MAKMMMEDTAVAGMWGSLRTTAQIQTAVPIMLSVGPLHAGEWPFAF